MSTIPPLIYSWAGGPVTPEPEPEVPVSVLPRPGPTGWRILIYHADQARDGRAVMIDEVFNADDRSLSEGVRRIGTFTFTVDRHNRAVPHLAGTFRRLIVVHDERMPSDALPLFAGPIVSFQDSGGRVQISCADAMWRLTKRRIGQSDAFRVGSSASLVGKDEIIRKIVQAVNENDLRTSRGGFFSGLAPPRGTVTGVGMGYAGPWRHKQAAEAIQEVAANVDGPEWRVVPESPKVYVPAEGDISRWPPRGTSIVFGRLQLAMVIGGALRSSAAFEIGTGRHNVRDYTRLITADGLMTHGYEIGGEPVEWRIYGGATNFAGGGTEWIEWMDNPYSVPYEDTVSSDLEVLELRRALLDDHLQVRRRPREVITFDPVKDLTDDTPTYGKDYFLGDLVPFRVAHDATMLIDVTMRVYGVTRALDSEGAETVSPQLVAQ